MDDVDMTVKELIEELQKWPQDMPVTILHEIDWVTRDDPHLIKVSKTTWTHTNWPYDKPDFDYIFLE